MREPAASPYRPLPPPGRVRRTVAWQALLVALGSALLLAYTTHKIDVMLRLRGDRPGIAPRAVRVGATLRSLGHGVTVIALHPEPWQPGEPGYEMQTTPGQRARLRPGTSAVVRCLEDERECFVRDSVYINDGNLAFDRSLRRLELACLAGALARVVLVWRRSARLVVARRRA